MTDHTVLSLKDRTTYAVESGVLFISDTEKEKADRFLEALNKFRQKSRERRGDTRTEDVIMRENFQLKELCSDLSSKLRSLDVIVSIGFPPESKIEAMSYEHCGIVIQGDGLSIEESKITLGSDNFKLESRSVPYYYVVDDESSSFQKLVEKIRKENMDWQSFMGREDYDADLNEGNGKNDKEEDEEIGDKSDLFSNVERLRNKWVNERYGGSKKISEGS
jgi:hypothetical protein